MSISSVAARIAELQTLVHGPPPASSSTSAASGTGGAASTGASFAALLDQRLAGATATPAAPGAYPGLAFFRPNDATWHVRWIGDFA